MHPRDLNPGTHSSRLPPEHADQGLSSDRQLNQSTALRMARPVGFELKFDASVYAGALQEPR